MQKNKIGIMTLFFNINYGATLQAYSLQKVLNEMGYECEDIWYYREIDGKSTMNEPLNIFLQIKKILRFLYEFPYITEKFKIRKGIKLREELFMDFIHTKMKTSNEKYDGHKDIKKTLEKYNAFVCGSDNIWNTNLLDTAFMLDFVPKTYPKISYAAGMSNINVDPKILNKMAGILKELDFISVREKSGVELVHKITNKATVQTLDPTLLRDEREWEEVEKEIDIPYKKYIFCYFFGTNILAREFAESLSREKGLPIITLPYMGRRYVKEDYRFGDLPLFNVGPAEFLWLIHNADYICTDSYHGTIFSILYRKKFWCFRRFFEEKTKSLNYRIDSLLEILNIKGRIIEDKNWKKYIDDHINYQEVYSILEEKREESKKYLKDSLETAIKNKSERRRKR